MDRETVTITTDASGDATSRTKPMCGLLQSIRYVAHGSTPFAAGVDFTITDDFTGAAILTVTDESGSATYYPRAAQVTVANAAALYAAAGQAVLDKIPILGQIKIVVAQGGNAKIGTFHIYVGG